MFEPSITFLHVRGIPIGAHWSWLLVFALIAWTLGSLLFPRTYPGLGTTTYWVMAVIAAVVFFGSILVHELGHALTAASHRMHIAGITLWLFGGVARFVSPFPSPGAEFKIAIAGPVITLILTVIFGVGAWLGANVGWPDAVRGVLDYLARINAIVLGFNLVPALPLDGGRVLRSWLWHRQESFEAATASAARAGKIFGGMLIAVGLLGFFTGADAGGLWIAFIGWFLFQAAQAEAQQATVRYAFRGLDVGDLMTRDPDTVRPGMTVQEFVDLAGGPRGHSTYPVTEDGRFLGMMSMRTAVGVAPEERGATRVRDVMVPADEAPTIDESTDAADALQVMQGKQARRAAVMERERMVGILSLSDLARVIERRQMRGEELEPKGKRTGIGVWIVVGLVLLLAAAALYRPPVVALTPGPAINVAEGITITGTTTEPVNGEYLLTSVQLARPTALGAAYAWFHPDRDVLPLSAVIPENVDPERFLERQQALFEESRIIAAAAAAQALGMQVGLEGTGASVQAVLENTPAAGQLQRGDVIVEIEGTPIELASQVAREIRARPPGTRFTITVERNGQTETVEVTSRRLGQLADPVVGIGVLLETRGLEVDLPFQIDFAERNVAGPSAGLAYGLAIADLLSDEDIADGRTIAATGTIDVGGNIGPVGGTDLKAVAADREGADIFLVPASEVDEVQEEGLRVRGVDVLSDALRTLGLST